MDKAGGLREALRMIHTARACGLQILLGCMVSSSASTTAAAHISPLVDFADLDGHLLVSDDPWEGVRVKDGRLILPERPGLGLVKRAAKQRLLSGDLVPLACGSSSGTLDEGERTG